ARGRFLSRRLLRPRSRRAPISSIRPVNLADVLLAAATATPTAPALVAGSRTISYGELDDVVARLGATLDERGVTPGSRVAIGADNDERFVAAYLAAVHVGAIAVPLNPLAPPAELGRQLEVVEPDVVL